jgi:hypothetical protein
LKRYRATPSDDGVVPLLEASRGRIGLRKYTPGWRRGLRSLATVLVAAAVVIAALLAI